MMDINTVAQTMGEARSSEQQGDWDTAVSQYLRALEEARMTQDNQRIMNILIALGRVCFERGEYDQANQRFLECLVLARTEGNLRESATALNALAIVAQFRGELDVAEPLYAQAEQIARTIEDHALVGKIAQNLGTLANIRGDLPTALLRYQTALERFQALGDDNASAWVLNNMGMLHIDVNELPEAELCFTAAYTLAERHGDCAALGKIDTNRAVLNIKRQNFEFAREYCDRAFARFSQLGSHSGLGQVHRCYGVLHLETDRHQVAQVQLALALELARRCDNPLLEAETENERARVFLALRDPKRALGSLNRAYKIFSELEARREILDLRRRLDRLEEPYVQAIQLWKQSGPDLHDTQKTLRGRRVAEFAVALARVIGVGDTTPLRIAAYLLDIGNAAIPKDILERPGPISSEERAVVREHAGIGEKMLRDVGFPSYVVDVVRYHHERWDGAGYPDQLAGADIPFGARIISIADYFDALISDRSFRPALNPAAALVILKSESGKAFDPDLLGTFLNLEMIRSMALGAELVPRELSVA